MQSKNVVSLSFSSDNKYVLVLGGSPDYTLVVYLWEKGKIITTFKPNMPNTWAAVNQVGMRCEEILEVTLVAVNLGRYMLSI